MAFRPAGIELVVKNFSGFMSSISRANKEIEKTGQTATRAANQINSYGVKVANAQRVVENAAGRVTQAQNRLANANDRAARSAVDSVRRQSAALQSLNTQMASLVLRRQKATESIQKFSDKEVIASNRVGEAKKNLQEIENSISKLWERNSQKIEAGNKRAYDLMNKMYDQRDKAAKKVNDLTNAETKATERVANAKANLAKIEAKMLENTKKGYQVVANAADKQADDAQKNARVVQNAEIDVERAVRNHLAAVEELARAQAELNAVYGGGDGGLGGAGGVGGLAGFGSKMVLGIGIAVAAAVAAVAVFRTLFNVLVNIAEFVKNVLVGAFNLLWSTIKAVASPIISIFKHLGSVVLNTLNQKLREVTTGLLDAVAEFQRFQILFEALQARDIANTLGIEMAEAFQRAIGPAKGLFNWVKQLAVTTPFTAKGITEVLAMANAMGLTTKEAKLLTEAVGNFTAGMGLTEEHMWRIIYNFGQMYAQGKVTGREFRDLAISFVPVWRMLDTMAQKAGIATEEFKKIALEGGVPVQAFFDEFIRMANSDFPNAMDRMARTWEGVVSNAKDFLQVIIGTNLVGPIFNRITSAMADSLQKLIKYLSPITVIIGRNLSFALDTIIVGFRNATDALDRFREAIGFASSKETNGFQLTIARIAVRIRELGNVIGEVIDWITKNIVGKLKNTAQNAGIWGYNIIAMLAQGMADAVDKFIIPVINYITEVISYWLSTSSPPKALPDLPKWGMGAMAEYLRGFTLADFDALEGIQGPLKEALSILVDTGQIGEAAAGKLYKDLSMAIAKAISTGVIEESLFKKIAKAAGPFGKEIAKLARLHIQLAQATNALVAAEKALEEAQKRESAARVAVNSKVREYNAMLRAGADKNALIAKLAEVNAAEDAARAATEERKKQEELVASLEAQVEALREAVELQERLVQQLLDITREQIIKVDTSQASSAIDDLADKISGLFATPKTIHPPWPESGAEVGGHPDFPSGDKLFQSWNTALKQAKEELENWKKEMGTLFDPLIGPGGAISRLEKEWSKLTRLFQSKKSHPDFGTKKGKTNFEILLDDLKNFWEEGKGYLTQIVERFGNAWGILFPKQDKRSVLAPILDGVLWLIKHLSAAALNLIEFGAILILFGNKIAEFKAQSDAWWASEKESINTWADETGQTIKDWVKQAGKFFSGIAEDIGEFTENAIDWFESILDSAGENFGSDGKIAMAISGFTMSAGATIAEFLLNAWNTFGEWWSKILVTVRRAVDDIHYKVLGTWVTILYYVNKKWNEIKEAIKAKIEEARDKVRDAINKVQGYLNSVSESKAVKAIQAIIDKAQALYDKIVDLLKKLGILKTTAADLENSDNAESNQFGGSVRKGKASIVGERGWEMFVPGASGMILNQAQIARVVSMAHNAVANYGARPMLYQTVMTAPVRAPMATSVNNTVNVNFGGVVIANDMDMAVFENRVRNVIRQEFA